ncbi:Uncharacterized protein HZ326_26475 [Fusarium oxysporum f. sp. albedinis]|nr:Uncharacterized protein HZ326_26475 [Fusarium oxysporum f. sp. albedinis]
MHHGRRDDKPRARPTLALPSQLVGPRNCPFTGMHDQYGRTGGPELENQRWLDGMVSVATIYTCIIPSEALPPNTS